MSASSVGYTSNHICLGQTVNKTGQVLGITANAPSNVILTSPILESGIYSISVHIQLESSSVSSLFAYFEVGVSTGLEQSLSDPSYNMTLEQDVNFVMNTNFIVQSFAGDNCDITASWNYTTLGALTNVTFLTSIVKIV